MDTTTDAVLPTGLPVLDRMLAGGLPRYSCTAVIGLPGTGKSILAQQLLFNHIRQHPERRGLYLTAFSESRARMVRNAQRLAFFDPAAYGNRVRYEDISPLLPECKPEDAVELVTRLVTEHRPDLLVIDSFRGLLDLPKISPSSRMFSFELSERLGYARCTGLFVGEYGGDEFQCRPEAAITDGTILLERRHGPDGAERGMRVMKLRGQPADPRPHRFAIGSQGIRVIARTDPAGLPLDEQVHPLAYPAGLDNPARQEVEQYR